MSGHRLHSKRQLLVIGWRIRAALKPGTETKTQTKKEKRAKTKTCLSSIQIGGIGGPSSLFPPLSHSSPLEDLFHFQCGKKKIKKQTPLEARWGAGWHTTPYHWSPEPSITDLSEGQERLLVVPALAGREFFGIEWPFGQAVRPLVIL